LIFPERSHFCHFILKFERKAISTNRHRGCGGAAVAAAAATNCRRHRGGCCGVWPRKE
jgi:hypothetical protein